MKLHSEDPRLTAYLLGELGAEEAAEVGKAIAADPALQVALREMESIRDTLTSALAPSPDNLLASQRTEILQAARKADFSGKPISFTPSRPRLKVWLVPLAAAAAVALAVFLVERTPATQRTSSAKTSTPDAAPKISSPKAAPNAVADNSPPAVPEQQHALFLPHSQKSVTVAESPSLDLPILTGKPDLSGITQSIRTERKLPNHEAVRLEEILNSFPIRLNGVTAIARVSKQGWHPDNRDEGMTTHAATLATETLACPWKPSATLLLISIRGNAANDCEAKVVFHPNAAGVFRYRLLGFAPGPNAVSKGIPNKLIAKSATTLAVEIEPSTATGELGAIEWSVNGEPATNITINRSGDNEPSDDARFAALVCTFAQWLAGEQSGIIDSDLLSAFAREIASSELPAERTDFLNLIDQSLHL